MVVDENLDPVVGSETGKSRLRIVITNDVYNERVPVIQVVPITPWNEKISLIRTNVVIEPTKANGLTKRSIADCLQTQPIDQAMRLKRIRGELKVELIEEIDQALS